MISCSAVRNSPYAKFLNVPLAAFGVIWFALMLAVSLKLCGRHGHSRAAHERYVADDMLFTAQIVWLAAGLASVFYFLYAEFVIGADPPLCTVVTSYRRAGVLRGAVINGAGISTRVRGS